MQSWLWSAVLPISSTSAAISKLVIQPVVERDQPTDNPYMKQNKRPAVISSSSVLINILIKVFIGRVGLDQH